MKTNAWLGMIVGFVLIIFPEPSTTIIGLGIVTYSAYKAGWLGRV